MVAEVMAMHKLSQRRACGLIGITRRAYQFKVRADRNLKLRKRLRELAEEKRRWGCPLLYQSLKREGFAVNHKRAAVPGRRAVAQAKAAAQESELCASGAAASRARQPGVGVGLRA